MKYRKYLLKKYIFVQENLSRRDTNRLGMSDYFIAPIQRIPRYCLMIKGK